MLSRHLLRTVSISANLDRFRLAREEGVAVVDVDGSYLTQKLDKLKQSGLKIIPSPLEFPSPPLSGWKIVSADICEDIATMQNATSYTWYVYISFNIVQLYYILYCRDVVYIADSLGHPCAGSFRALKRGYLHCGFWMSSEDRCKYQKS